MSEGLRVKLVTGDVRHLSEVATSSVFFGEIETASRLGHTVYWVMTEEGTRVNAMQVVEVGEPKIELDTTEHEGRYTIRCWDNSRADRVLYGVWDLWKNDWIPGERGASEDSARRHASKLNAGDGS